jgi:hypothetical protein
MRTVAGVIEKGDTTWEEVHGDGEELSFAKLIPSFVDRKPFFEHLTLGPIRRITSK